MFLFTTKIYLADFRFVNDPAWLRLDEKLRNVKERGVVLTCCFKSGFFHGGIDGRGTFDFCINPNFTTHVRDTLFRSTSVTPSTGLVATMFLLNVCKRLDLFGFDFGAKNSANHYYDDRKLRTKTHNFAREKYIIHEFHNRKFLFLHVFKNKIK